MKKKQLFFCQTDCWLCCSTREDSLMKLGGNLFLYQSWYNIYSTLLKKKKNGKQWIDFSLISTLKRLGALWPVTRFQPRLVIRRGRWFHGVFYVSMRGRFVSTNGTLNKSQEEVDAPGCLVHVVRWRLTYLSYCGPSPRATTGGSLFHFTDHCKMNWRIAKANYPYVETSMMIGVHGVLWWAGIQSRGYSYCTYSSPL